MYKTSIECYKEPSERHIKYEHYKGPVVQSNEKFTHSLTPSVNSIQNTPSESISSTSTTYSTPIDSMSSTSVTYSTPIDSMSSTSATYNTPSVPHLTWKTEKYNNLSDPNVWGPAFWFSLHNGAAKYPISASPMTIERMKNYIIGLPVMLPCEKCQYHATNHIMKNKDKLDEICSGRDSLFAFFVDFHNIVNKKYNKPVMSVEEASNLYKGGAVISKLSY